MSDPTDRDHEMARELNVLLAKSLPFTHHGKIASALAAAREEGREEGRREERARCARIATEIRDDARRDIDGDDPELQADRDAATCWADCANSILREISTPSREA